MWELLCIKLFAGKQASAFSVVPNALYLKTEQIDSSTHCELHFHSIVLKICKICNHSVSELWFYLRLKNKMILEESFSFHEQNIKGRNIQF